jgi:nucleoside 2-deoxyribosyltransferase
MFTEEQQANISGYIRENQGLQILERDLNALKSLRTPAVGEKATKGLIALSKLRPVPGQFFSYNFELTEQRLLLLRAAAIDGKDISKTCDDELRELLAFQASCWARSFQELRYIVEQYFRHEGLVHYNSSGAAQIAPKGWALIDEARRGTIPSDKAFVAMAFRPFLQPLYDEGLYIGIRKAGYDPIRIDRVQHNNRIDDEIIATIRRCKFVVADFTLNRGGIYFEAGFAMGLNRPVIWTAPEGKLHRVHFDTRQYNFVRWTRDDLKTFAQALQNRIEATIGRGPLAPIE